MKSSKVRIILDTNLWISFLINQNLSFLDKMIFEEKITLIFSKELFEEFIEVVKRPKFQKIFSFNLIEKILEIIEKYAEFIQVTSDIQLCRDKKDNFLLSLAVDGQADYLITGDKDLLILGNIENTQIITVTEFIKISG